jgi:ABC-type antimicrobial peptide transport system permease subunit
MKTQVLTQIAKVVEKLGYYNVLPRVPLLDILEDYQSGVVMLACVFNVVLILMCAISIILIYSLLMVSVNKRTFDNGVMRMVGISKMDCVLSITMQSLSFVVPSIIVSYSLAILINHFLLQMMFTPEMGLS